jgi:hypothetical protein
MKLDAPAGDRLLKGRLPPKGLFFPGCPSSAAAFARRRLSAIQQVTGDSTQIAGNAKSQSGAKAQERQKERMGLYDDNLVS